MMDRDRWEQIEQLYHAALEHGPDARDAFLSEACAGDEELRREVAGLLACDVPSDSFIRSPAIDIVARAMAAEPLIEASNKPMGNLIAGSQIGAYQLLEPLGRGGMGEVHLALDTRLRRKVAVKLLPAEFTTDDNRVRRFAQEARAVSALNHPNIITIHEIGETAIENGVLRYIVTEYVEGETLRQRIARVPQRRIEPTEAIDIALQIAAALSAAHEAGITHRDIKPENVMARRDGIVKVLDFGLAKLTEPAAPAIDTQAPTLQRVTSTESGMVMGTPRYMSPEQARGEKLDARTDIFSLGVLLYEMVSGRAPFAGTTPGEVIASILRDTPPPLAECMLDAPQELEQIIGKALLKDRAQRYQTASELLTNLKELKQRIEIEAKLGETAFVVPPSGGSSGRRNIPPEGGTTKATRKHLIFVAAALFITAMAGWFYFNRKPALTEKDTILLADFENKTGEEFFEGMLKQGLAIHTSYFIDGTPYSYFPVAAGDPVPLNVGWLDAHHEFRKTKHPDDLSNKLAWLCVNAEAQATRGIHICELCPRMNDGYYRLQIPKREDFLLGTAEIRISSAKAIYAAPNLILHYVADHHYSPPDDFIEAVLALPDSNSILEWRLVRGAYW